MIKEGIFAILATFLFLCSCDKAETMYSLKMNDGKVLTILPTSASYKSEKELLQQIPFIVCAKASVDNDETRTLYAGLRAYGYDSMEPESDWKKYLLSNWTDYGVEKNIYIGRYVKVHQNLSLEKGTYAKPADYTVDKAPKNRMGWDTATSYKNPVIGFSATGTSDYIADGTTRVFIIKCDLDGIVLDKYIPADPRTFLWAYELDKKVDIWD